METEATVALEPSRQIETQYQPLRFQHEVTGIVTACCRRLSIREGKGERMLADIALNPETDLGVGFVRKTDDVEVVVEHRESSSELKTGPRCEFEQRQSIRCDQHARSEPEG